MVAPLRRRAGDATTALSVSGRDTAGRVRTSAGVAAGYRVRRAGEQVLRSGLLEELVHRLTSTTAFDHVVTVVMDHPATEKMISRAFDDPSVDRLLARIQDRHGLHAVTPPSALTRPAAWRSS